MALHHVFREHTALSKIGAAGGSWGRVIFMTSWASITRLSLVIDACKGYRREVKEKEVKKRGM